MGDFDGVADLRGDSVGDPDVRETNGNFNVSGDSFGDPDVGRTLMGTL